MSASSKMAMDRGSECGHRAGFGGSAVVLPRECVRQVEAHAQGAYPDECCGVLIGAPGTRRLVRSVHATENQYSGSRRDRFEIDPREILTLDRHAEDAGLEIVGFYHSHPDHPARPSATDAKYAWPAYVYVIASVTKDGADAVTAWLYEETRREFEECPLVFEDAATRAKKESTNHGREG